MRFLALYFAVALVVSFFCSLMEAVMLSVSHGYLGALVRQGRRSGMTKKKRFDGVAKQKVTVFPGKSRIEALWLYCSIT